jgi:hypothetical protein
MSAQELEVFDENPEWRLLLAAYQQKPGAGQPDWIPRLEAVDGLTCEQLSAIHGRLIAWGLLLFELGAATEGVRYQLTPLGKQALVPPEKRQFVPEWQQVAEEQDPVAVGA